MQISMYANRAAESGFVLLSLSFLFLSLNSSLATHFTPAGKNTADATRHQPLHPPTQGEDEPVMHIAFPRLNLCLGLQQSLYKKKKKSVFFPKAANPHKGPACEVLILHHIKHKRQDVEEPFDSGRKVEKVQSPLSIGRTCHRL